MTLFRQPITALGLNIAESVDIETPMGPLRGQKSIYSDKEGLFLGIPFAEPPVGDLRWKAPQPAKGWTERRDATRTPKACLQGKPYDLTSEDCLYLNVYTSNLAATSAGGEGAGDAPLKPVMFWIYGGSFEMGGGVSEGKGIDIYDSQAMAHLGDVVVVTINYRLGALGFMALDELRRESPEAGSGNYGLQDQREALRWVQRNIKAFGGDPDRVTIFGESAGAMSVMFHVASKRSAGLFHGAIMQSGNEIGRTWSQATQEGASVVKSLGCAGDADVLACLRSKSGRDVINADAHEVPVPHNADSTLKFGPVVDGVELAVLPRELYATGQLNDVNMMVGTNLNEGAAFVCQKIPPTTPDSEYLAQVAHYVGEDTAQQLVDLFPLKNYKLVRDAIIDLSTAYFFTCPSRHISAGIRNATGRVGSTYRYQLRHAPGILALSAPFYGGGWPTSFCMGVMHMLDLAYTFHNLRFILSPAEKVLSDQMTRFWTNFAHSGDPNIDANGVDARIWPAYEPQAGEDLTVSLDTPIGVLSDLDAARCAVIDKLQDAALSRQNGPPNVLQFLPVM